VPRRAKGPRLWFRPARDNRLGAWFVLDGTRQRGTGLGVGASASEKDKALGDYLAEKHTKAVTSSKRDPSAILVDDVLALYARDVAPNHARPHETAARIAFLRKFWGGRRLSEVIGATCREYADSRSTAGAARRELEELRAAINHHRREGLHDRIVSVVLPEKAEPREAWLTRDEAAALVGSAWRYKERQKGHETGRRSRQHVARFMIVASYMGSRAAVICGASIEDRRPAGKPWVDLTTGVFYGRPVGQKKTKKRRQTVRVPLPLLAHMRRWRRRGQRYVVEWQGEPVTRINKAHDASVAAAGLPTTGSGKITPHTWRHTAVTWAMQGGADPWKAADFFGMTIEVLMRTYGHHHPAHSADVHAAFSANRRRQKKAA